MVNALSSKLVATVKRDGYEWSQSFERGKPTSKLQKRSKTKEHGTSIFFKPDTEIFRSITFSSERLEKMIAEKAFLNKGLELTFVDEKSKTEKKFLYPDGIKSYLASILEKGQMTPIIA